LTYQNLDAEYKPESLDDVIKTCENLHVGEPHQLKILLKNMNICLMEYLQSSTWNKQSMSLQLIDPNCKPIHTRAYTVPRSVEQQLQQSKEIVRLVDIEVLEEDYFSEWSSFFP
jgi:hypothetical protein